MSLFHRHVNALTVTGPWQTRLLLNGHTRNSIVTPGRVLYNAGGMDETAIRRAALITLRLSDQSALRQGGSRVAQVAASAGVRGPSVGLG